MLRRILSGVVHRGSPGGGAGSGAGLPAACGPTLRVAWCFSGKSL